MHGWAWPQEEVGQSRCGPWVPVQLIHILDDRAKEKSFLGKQLDDICLLGSVAAASGRGGPGSEPVSLRDIGMEFHNCPHTETVGRGICKPHGFMFKVERHFTWNWEVLNPRSVLCVGRSLE